MGELTIGIIAILFVLGVLRPAWCLAIVTLMFPLEQLLQASSGAFLARPYLGNVMVGALALLTAVRLSLSGRGLLLPFWTPTLLATLGLYLWGALSLVWTFAPAYLLDSMLHSMPYFVVLIVLAPALVSAVRDMTEFRIAVLFTGTALALLILLNPNFRFYNTRYVLALDAVERSNPLEIGALGGMLVIAAALGSPRDGTLVFLTRCAAFVVGLGLGLLSGSRGEVLAAIAVGVLFLPLARKIADVRQFLLTTSAAAVILVAIVVVQSFFIGIDNRDRWSMESVTSGSGGRVENVLDLAMSYFNYPALWPIGLGSAAFHDLPTASGDPYSHVLLMDLIFELGIPGVVLGAIIFLTAFKTGRSLLARTAVDPSLRSGMGFLVGLAAFEFIIANKAGTIWGNIDLFCYCCIIARLFSISKTEEHPEPVDQVDAEGDPADEFPEDLAPEPELARMAER
jgi:hypothetical protein